MTVVPHYLKKNKKRMSLYNGFCALFDEVHKQDGCKVTLGSWDISESDEGASLKTVSITDPHQTFYTLKDSTYKKLFGCFISKSSHLKDLDCDGVAFIYGHKKAEAIVLLAELKSSPKKIQKACKQALFAYLKLHAVLSLCECNGVLLKDHHVVFWIICHEKEWDYQENIISKQLDKEGAGSQINNSFVRKLYKKKSLHTNLGNLINVMPINSEIKKLQVQINLSLVDVDSKGGANLDLSDIL